MMTKKDFEAIASILKAPLESIRKAKLHNDLEDKDRSYRDWLDGRGMMVYELVAELSYYFEQVNPAFDRVRFYKECGIEPNFKVNSDKLQGVN
jgi:hypothetical protein